MALSRLHQLVIAVIVISLTGCASLKSGLQIAVKKPTVEVADVRITSFGVEQVSLLFELKVDNPNNFDLKSQGFDYQLAVEQRSILAIDKPEQAIDLPAKGTGTINLPVEIRYLDLYQVIAGLREKSEFHYRLEAGFYFNLPVLGNTRIATQWQDKLPIPKLPNIEMTQAKLSDLSLSGATLDVTLSLQNFNAFDLNLNHFDYRLSANGRSIADGQVKNIHVAQAQVTEVTLPLSLKFSELGFAVYQLLISDQSVRIGLNGQLDLVPDLPLWRPGPIEFNVSQQLTQ
jgi:LEA14-like dessication related protein